MGNEETIADVIARRALAGKVWCFVANPNPYPRQHDYILGIAVLGEAGWNPLSEFSFSTYDACSDRANELNKLLPWTDDACIAIIADTMERSRMRQAESKRDPYTREYKVRVTYASVRDIPNADAVAKVISDAFLTEGWIDGDVEVTEL